MNITNKLLLLLLLPCFAHAAAPTIVCAPTRATGVAPLSVLVDCTATVDGSVTAPFHDDHFEHSFGDEGAGFWSNGANSNSSKNFAIGAVASHVYEAAGTYQITSRACNVAGCSSTTNSITVSDPDTVFAGKNTICFSTSGTFTSCPAGAQHVTTNNFQAAINSYKGANKRLLFRRGEVFSESVHATINTNGPGIVGAFGVGAQPIINTTSVSADDSMIQLSSASTPNIGDWRIMDLDFEGQGNTFVIGVDAQGGFKRFLSLRNQFNNIRRGISFGLSILDWWNTHRAGTHEVFSEIAVVDNHMLNTGMSCNEQHGRGLCDWRIFLGGVHSSIQGNYLDGSTTGGSHIIRTSFMQNSVIENNTIANAGEAQSNIKMHAATWSGGVPTPISLFGRLDGWTKLNIVSENKFIGGAITGGNVWVFHMGPQDSANDERVKDIIVERNWFTGSGSTVARQMHIGATDITVRNNLCDVTGASSHSCFEVQRWGGGNQITPTNIRFLNNTIYSASTGNFNAVVIDAMSTNITLKNNLAYAPNSTNPVMNNGAGASGFVQSGNSTNTQIKYTSPLFEGTTNPVDFRIGTGSYALNGGTAVFPSSRHDFLDCADKNGNVRIGAFVPKTYSLCRLTTR